MKFYNLDSVTDTGNPGNLMLDAISREAAGLLSIQQLLTDWLPQTLLLENIAGTSINLSAYPYAIQAAFDDGDDDDDAVESDDDDFNDDDFDDDYDDDDFEDDDIDDDDDLSDDDSDLDDDDVEVDANDDDFVDDDFGGSSAW